MLGPVKGVLEWGRKIEVNGSLKRHTHSLDREKNYSFDYYCDTFFIVCSMAVWFIFLISMH